MHRVRNTAYYCEMLRVSTADCALLRAALKAQSTTESKGIRESRARLCRRSREMTPLLCSARIMRVGISLPNRDRGWLRQEFRHFMKTTKS